MAELKLFLETDWVRECLVEASSLLQLDLDGSLPLEFRQQALSLFEAPFEMFCIDLNRSAAAGTGEQRIRLKPTDAFLQFLLAMRALNRDSNVAV